MSATTGSGKSTVTIIPSILKINNASLVVHDPGF
ncbi:MAG: type IV secretory system conjugative DNA transfer family protein [Bacteroidetes bacterium]|nr:type IV secretory system conjugative DNA transfer family protein [Bacteroidota bacterium]